MERRFWPFLCLALGALGAFLGGQMGSGRPVPREPAVVVKPEATRPVQDELHFEEMQARLLDALANLPQGRSVDLPSPASIDELLAVGSRLVERLEELSLNLARGAPGPGSGRPVLRNRGTTIQFAGLFPGGVSVEERQDYLQRELFLMGMQEALDRFGVPTDVFLDEKSVQWHYSFGDAEQWGLVLFFVDGMVMRSDWYE